MKYKLLALSVAIAFESTGALALSTPQDLLTDPIASIAATPSIAATVAPAPTRAEANQRSYQSFMNQINLPYANQLGKANGAGIVVGVADTGAQVNHPELKGQIVKSYNVFTGTADVTDTVGHGTHVAGLIAGTMANGAPLGGVAPGAKIAMAKVFNGSGSTTSDKIDAGINWLVNTAKTPIISLSLGGSSPMSAGALQNGVNKGTLFTIATGNDGAKEPSWPARYAAQTWSKGQIIAVAAVDSSNKLASFSNWCGSAAANCVVAPGVNIASSYLNNQYAYMSGTSMATPIVAGQAALIESLWPQLKANQVSQIIFTTATRLGTGTATRPDAQYGWGLINVGKSLQPIGTVSVATANGKTTSVNTISIGSAKGALGASIRSAAASGAFAIAGTDFFNRQYIYDKGATIAPAEPISAEQVMSSADRLMHYGEVALDSKGSRMAFAISAPNEFSTANNLGGATEQLAKRNTLAGFASVQKLADGDEVASGFGGMNLFFGLAGTEIADAPALTHAGLANSYMDLVPSASTFGYGKNLGAGVKMKIGFATSALAKPTYSQLGYNDTNPEQSNMVMAELNKNFDNSAIGVGVSTVNERNAVLGTQMGNGFDFDHSANTQVITFNAAHKIAKGVALAGYVSEGFTRGFSNGGSSLITGATETRSQSFGVGLVTASTFIDGDSVTLSYSSPLHTTSGSLLLDVPTTVDSDGNLVREERNVALNKSLRETRTEAAYYIPLTSNSALSSSLMIRRNVDGIAGPSEIVGALRYSMKF